MNPYETSAAKVQILHPPTRAFDVTPSDSADMAIVPTMIYIGGTGALKVDMMGSGTVTLTGLPAGAFVSIRARRVYATGTTATGIIGFY